MGDQLDDVLASGTPLVAMSGIGVILAFAGVTLRFARWALQRWS